MSFKRLDQEDIVISADSITAPAWSGNVVELTTFHTSSAQTSSISGEYYYDVKNANDITDTSAAIQFAVSHGHIDGLGHDGLSQITASSATRATYGQMRTLINGTEETNITFGGGVTPSSIHVISINRSRYKEKIFPGSLTLKLSGSGATDKLLLTDDSNYTTTETFTDAGRVYNIISGSAGTRTSSPKDSGALGYSQNSGSYGLLLPDAGLIVLNGWALFNNISAGGINLATGSNYTNQAIHENLFTAIKSGSSFSLRSEETVSSNYVFVRARNSEFNYSTNPSNITGSGELRHSVMIDSPQSYVTAVGLYNDNNDLLAVAKLSRPLLKDFTKEALIRIKLDY